MQRLYHPPRSHVIPTAGRALRFPILCPRFLLGHVLWIVGGWAYTYDIPTAERVVRLQLLRPRCGPVGHVLQTMNAHKVSFYFEYDVVIRHP